MTRNLNVKQLSLATAAVAIVVVAVWYLALLKPQSHELASARKADAAAKAQQVTLQQQVGALQALEKQIPADQAKYARYQQAIPSTPELSAAIREIQAAANSSGVTMSSLAPVVPTGTNSSAAAGTVSGATTIPVSISATGAYGNLTAFVAALNAMPRTFVVQSLNLGGSGGSMSASITGAMFYTGAPAAS